MTYRVALETEGYTIAEASSGAEALEKLKATAFDMAVLDMRMPEMDGIALLHAMRALELATPAVIITAFGDVPHAVEAMKYGAIDFLRKRSNRKNYARSLAKSCSGIILPFIGSPRMNSRGTCGRRSGS